MAKLMIRHECGHKSRVDVGDGNAASKSARAFEASLEICQDCRDACPHDGEAQEMYDLDNSAILVCARCGQVI